MIKLSVKKPFTILVAVIMVIVLGVVSITGMTADLLPQISLPYLMVITTYPGASPERVEEDVVRPLESALGTISGVTGVYSTCSENFGMVQLEFEEDTNMDSTLVKVSSALQEASASLPEMCSTPSIIELSMDMMATMYVSVSREGYDIYQLSGFVKNTVQPFLERQEGVAEITPLGLVEQSIHVELDQIKINALNVKILATVNTALGTSAADLDAAEKQVAAGKAELEKAQASFGQTMADTLFGQIEESVTASAKELKSSIDNLLTQIKDLRKAVSDGQIGEKLDSLILELENISRMLEDEALSAEELLLITGSMRSLMEDARQLLELISSDAEQSTAAESIQQLRDQLNAI